MVDPAMVEMAFLAYLNSPEKHDKDAMRDALAAVLPAVRRAALEQAAATPARMAVELYKAGNKSAGDVAFGIAAAIRAMEDETP